MSRNKTSQQGGNPIGSNPQTIRTEKGLSKMISNTNEKRNVFPVKPIPADIGDFVEYRAGVLYWKVTRQGVAKAGRLAGTFRPDGRSRLRLNGKEYGINRVVWFLHHGDIPEGYLIDHIDGDQLNNSIENLRLATHAQNTWNSKRYSTNKTGYKGVMFNKQTGLWFASIVTNGRRVYLGSFTHPLLASYAYRFACRFFHKEFGRFE